MIEKRGKGSTFVGCCSRRQNRSLDISSCVRKAFNTESFQWRGAYASRCDFLTTSEQAILKGAIRLLSSIRGPSPAPPRDVLCVGKPVPSDGKLEDLEEVPPGNVLGRKIVCQNDYKCNIEGIGIQPTTSAYLLN
ncbi:unnamed protein product [Rangifer tarandus platyrhynchus]|uniref:Uncharacterized protein n=1 Tax=Rangifer tarandus platyrhynchus TaxID=3082113 RepID=A0ABN8ZU92_RANTA|nr:unnamed protein product [Rangifer tarandus platyrhynchus]